MKIILALVLFSSAFNSFAINWDEKVRGTNYTIRELQMQQNMIRNSVRQKQKIANKLDGRGVDFSGAVSITSAPTQENPQKKSYKVYIRGCGNVELTEKSPSEMANLKNGTMVKLKFSGSRTCEVSDWDKQ